MRALVTGGISIGKSANREELAVLELNSGADAGVTRGESLGVCVHFHLNKFLTVRLAFCTRSVLRACANMCMHTRMREYVRA